MKNIKPVNVVFQQGVLPGQAASILKAIYVLLQLAEVSNEIEIRNFAHWRQPGWQDSTGDLIPYYSVDWYIREARKASRNNNQLNGDTIINSLFSEPWQKIEPHYDVFVLNKDMYSGDTNFVLGLGCAGLGTVISLSRLSTCQSLREETMQTLLFHELGHAFGLIPKSRTINVSESLGRHCSAFGCTMRQGINVPNDWITFTKQRLDRWQIFCDQCENDLVNWFK